MHLRTILGKFIIGLFFPNILGLKDLLSCHQLTFICACTKDINTWSGVLESVMQQVCLSVSTLPQLKWHKFNTSGHILLPFRLFTSQKKHQFFAQANIHHIKKVDSFVKAALIQSGAHQTTCKHTKRAIEFWVFIWIATDNNFDSRLIHSKISFLMIFQFRYWDALAV